MNQRYQTTFERDPDLYLTISLTNVFIIKVSYLKKFLKFLKFNLFNILCQDPLITQWTNTTLCSVAGYPTYNGKTPILNNCVLTTFKNYMNSIAQKLPFTFDHAVAVLGSE